MGAAFVTPEKQYWPCAGNGYAVNTKLVYIFFCSALISGVWFIHSPQRHAGSSNPDWALDLIIALWALRSLITVLCNEVCPVNCGVSVTKCVCVYMLAVSRSFQSDDRISIQWTPVCVTGFEEVCMCWAITFSSRNWEVKLKELVSKGWFKIVLWLKGEIDIGEKTDTMMAACLH